MFDNIPFYKMHGLGNDFVIIDAREQLIPLPSNQIRLIAHRKEGVGCDQVIVLEPSTKADLLMRIYNANGEEVGMCGNALRCVGALVMSHEQKEECQIELITGIRHVSYSDDQLIKVNMGQARFGWQDIPLSHEMNTMPLDLQVDQFEKPYAISVGNPHLVFWVEDANQINLTDLGEQLENHDYFPEGINVEIAQILDQHTILMRVWERGVGLTDACGSGACAVAMASYKAGKTKNDVIVYMPGGTLKIEIDETDTIFMSGPATLTFCGTIILDPQIEQ